MSVLRSRAARLAAASAALLVLAGCASGDGADDEASPAAPAASDSAAQEDDADSSSESPKQQTEKPEKSEKQEGVVVVVTIADGSITPRAKEIEGRVGEPITLRVTSDVVDELHVHGEPEATFAVEPGPEQEFTFAIKVPGQVAVESHEIGGTIVELLVRP